MSQKVKGVSNYDMSEDGNDTARPDCTCNVCSDYNARLDEAFQPKYLNCNDEPLYRTAGDFRSVYCDNADVLYKKTKDKRSKTGMAVCSVRNKTPKELIEHRNKKQHYLRARGFNKLIGRKFVKASTAQ